MVQSNDRISHAEAAAVVSDKKTMYEALLRNQWYTPHYSSQILNLHFMFGVANQTLYWLPRTHEIRLLNCADPPPKQVIANILCDKMMHFEHQGEPFDTSFRRTALKIKQHPPNKEWMLGVLSTLDPQNELFTKAYVKPRPDCKPADTKNTVKNVGGFFTGLPVHKLRKRHIINFKEPAEVQDELNRRMSAAVARHREET